MTGPLIVACNHASYLDPVALGVAMHRPVSYMAKAELFRVPILGPILRGIETFPVDRGKGSMAAIKRSVDILRQGRVFGIFPEGTRVRTGDERRLHTGVALIASLAGAPVLPAYVGGSEHWNRFPFPKITVTFGKPLVFTRQEKARREELAKWTEEIMTQILALAENTRAN